MLNCAPDFYRNVSYKTFYFLCKKITCQNTQGHVEPGDDINFVIDKLYSILSLYVLTFSFLFVLCLVFEGDVLGVFCQITTFN